jgi:UDP-2,3-diacylglucosamine hydrolase
VSNAIIVSDVHLGHSPPDTARAFHSFLETVPQAEDHVVLNGDIFEFWFEYRHVIPRAAFPTLERLAALRARGCRLTLTGGNHDRWGGPFWREYLRADFFPSGSRMELGGRRAWVHHGDGLTERGLASRMLHAAITSRLTVTTFGLLHPDLGIGLVRRLSPWLAGKRRDAKSREAARVRQRQLAARLLDEDSGLELVVLGHTHEPWIEQLHPGRWYLNPGAWAEGCRYATVTAEGPQLKRYGA